MSFSKKMGKLHINIIKKHEFFENYIYVLRLLNKNIELLGREVSLYKLNKY